MIKIYVDESGVHAGAEVVTVAAYAGRPNVWRKWISEWQRAKRPIGIYHAADAANLRGEFSGWTAERRDELVKNVLPVIAGSPIAGAAIGLHMQEFRNACAGRKDIPEALGNPYTTCFHWLVQTVLELVKHNERDEALKFVHEQNDYQGDARGSFDWIRDNVNPNKVRMRLAFGTKKDHVPLQAADILAYEANKRFRDAARPERKAWQAMDPDNKIVCAHFGKENMGEFIKHLSELALRPTEAAKDPSK
jgi:hypothetical protein